MHSWPKENLEIIETRTARMKRMSTGTIYILMAVKLAAARYKHSYIPLYSINHCHRFTGQCH